MCVLFCDKGCWVLQDNRVIEVGDLKAMRLAWVPVHPHEFHSLLVDLLILAGPSASLLSPLHIHLPFSVQLSCSVVSDCVWPHVLQHTRLPCPLLSPRVCSNSCPLSQWCHPIISSSVGPFSSCPQSFQYFSLFQWVSSLHQVAQVLYFLSFNVWTA